MNLAPIALFIYNRPLHTEKTIESLAKNIQANQSELIIFADGPRNNQNKVEVESINLTRMLARNAKGFKSVKIFESSTNLGLKTNVISGINKIFEKFEKVIVVEDDLITSKYFLTYCNECLEVYSNSCNIFSISAYQHPIKFEKTETFLCPFINSWGWATWKSKWGIYEPTQNELNTIKNKKWISTRFNLGDFNYDHMFENKKSWAILWYYYVFIHNGLNVWPTKSLVYNIGHDGSGENSGIYYNGPTLFNESIKIDRKTNLDLDSLSLFYNYFDKKPTPPLHQRIKNKICNLFKK